MLKKDLYANVYILTALVLIGAVGYYVFVLQRDIAESFNQDPRIVQISTDQSRMGQQIVKNALGMGYSRNQGQFDFFRNELAGMYVNWQKAHNALIEGDPELGISKPVETDEYLQLQEELNIS